MLALACCALLCGVRRSSALAAWGRNDGSASAPARGFTPHTPCAATLHTILRRFDCEGCEATWGVWAARGVTQTPATPAAPEAARAVDGKPLRGSTQQGAPGTPLLSVLAHRLGRTLTPQAVAAKTNEITAVETV